MKKPKHIDVMTGINKSIYRNGNRKLPPSKWAELVKAIAEDVENDELDEEGRRRVLTALGRAAAEMEQHEQKLKAAENEVAVLRGGDPPHMRKKEPRVKPEAAD